MKKIDLTEKEKDIELVFIFGSQKEKAIQYLRGGSIVKQKEPDLDLGILLSREAYQNIDDKFTYYGQLYDIFSNLLPDFRLDLVLLNEVSIFIQVEAVKGYKLYQRNQNVFDEYIEGLNKKYNDLNFVRKMYYREMQEAILHE